MNTHGLRGEVKVKSTSDFAQLRFQQGNIVDLQFEQTLLPLTIQYVKENKGLLIVKFKDYDDINEVEGWKGSVLSVKEDELPVLEEDEAYFFELKDSEVFDEEGNELGCVIDVIDTAANAILRVKGKEQEFLVPYVKAFIISFDKEAKKIVIRMMDGLL